ncbi:exocyst complex component EXO70B1-like [Quercus robur]|uniref:exocyst complex component EXO70B1-like n=1 Tax=Quercus robur TaxID=38942 RepID=UPI002163E1B2|nr:exocyst complex component EXO70B1-like [Quercus robur]
MSTTSMTGINIAQHIVQNLNTPVKADEDNEDNLIDPKAVVELREIETRMVRQVYRESSVSLVAGSFFPSAKSEAGSGSWDWDETNPDSPLNISSLFPSNKSETESSPEFSRSNSDSIMSIFLPATSPIDSPENYEIIVRSRSIPSYSIMSIFPPAMSETDSPDNYEIIFRNPSIPSYYHFFPPDMSDTDSYGSSPPMQFSIPSLHFPPNKSETINSSLVINGISLEERILGGIEKMDKCIQAIDILQSNRVVDLMFIRTDDEEEIGFNRTLLNFSRAVALRRGRSPENLFMILDAYDEMAEAMKLLAHDPKSNQARAMLTERETLIDLENKKQNAMQSGDIHPLTQTMMNCVKLIVDYSDTQNLLEIGEDDAQLDALRNHDSNSLKMNPLASQLLVLINFLESNLEKESKLYGDGVLQYIFLMNNILYMNQKMKDWDLGGLLGDNWDRKQHKQTRQYAMSYLRASWTKVLDCLNDRGIPRSSSSKASTVALQKRLKKFNTCFEKIYRVQTAWKVPDAQLREELRTSISEMVIPTYRSFMGRFGNQEKSGRHAEKYIEYTADDLESYLFNLFEGVPRVLHRRRRKVHRIKQDSHEGLELRTLVSIKPPVMGRVKRVLIQFNKA